MYMMRSMSDLFMNSVGDMYSIFFEISVMLFFCVISFSLMDSGIWNSCARDFIVCGMANLLVVEKINIVFLGGSSMDLRVHF